MSIIAMDGSNEDTNSIFNVMSETSFSIWQETVCMEYEMTLRHYEEQWIILLVAKFISLEILNLFLCKSILSTVK